MGFFSKAKGNLSNFLKSAKNVTNKDVLVATCGVCVSVACVDGDYSKEEFATISSMIANDDRLKSFTQNDIDQAMAKFTVNFSQPHMIPVGKIHVNTALEVSTLVKEEKQMIIAMALAVAGADGNIDKDELDLIETYSRKLGVSMSLFGY